MSVYKRGKIWWVKFHFDGCEVRRSSKTTVKREAENYERKLRQEMTRVYQGDRPRVLFGDAIIEFVKTHLPTLKPKSAERYMTSLRAITALISVDLYMDQITKGLIAEFVKKRRMIVKDPTIRRDIACLSKIFECCIDWDWLEFNPVKTFNTRQIKESIPRIRFLTSNEERRLFKHITDYIEKIARFALYTGMPLGEIVSLEHADIDTDRREISLPRAKTTAPRLIPLSGEAWAQIWAQPRHIATDLVFWQQEGIAYRVDTVSKCFARAVKRANIKNFTFHDLRHTYASRFVQSGGDLYRLQRILGHKNITQTMKYAHLRPQDLRTEVNRLGTNSGTGATDYKIGDTSYVIEFKSK